MKLDEDCRQRTRDNNRDRDAIGMDTAPRSDRIVWIVHFADKGVIQRSNGYCPSRTVLDPNTTERVKTSATRSWDEAVELGERDMSMSSESGDDAIKSRHVSDSQERQSPVSPIQLAHNALFHFPHPTGQVGAQMQLPLKWAFETESIV